MAKGKDALDRVSFIKMTKEEDVLKLGDQLMYGTPLIINFESYDEVQGTKVITFLSGVTYAIDGEIEQIHDKIFLFASKKDYKDGSLRKFIKDYKNR